MRKSGCVFSFCKPVGSDLSFIPSHNPMNVPRQCLQQYLDGVSPNHLAFPAFILRTRAHLVLCLLSCQVFVKMALPNLFTAPRDSSITTRPQSTPSLAASLDPRLLGPPPHCSSGCSYLILRGGAPRGSPAPLPPWLPARNPILLLMKAEEGCSNPSPPILNPQASRGDVATTKCRVDT